MTMSRLVVAHLSDTHFGIPGAADRVCRVLDHLRAMSPPPALLVVTGDVADRGLEEEYADARAVLDTWTGTWSSRYLIKRPLEHVSTTSAPRTPLRSGSRSAP